MLNKDSSKNWEWKKLGEVCLSKGQYGSGASKVYFDSKVRYIRITDIGDRGNLKDDEMVSPSTVEEDCFLEENDLLFARSGSVGRTYLHKKRDNLNYQYAGYLIRFKINAKIANPEFIYYLTKSPQYYNWIESIKKSGTISNINAREFASYELPLPPLPTQRKIVSILERAENLKNLRQEANEETNTIIQALFYEMFGDPQTNPITFDNEIRYIRITDVNEDGSLRYDSVASPSEVEDEYFLKKGDLLFARSGATVGKTYLHKEEKHNSIYAGYMIRFRFKEQICNPVFVNAITKTKYYKNWLLSNQTQVAQPNINAQQYGGFKIILPSISLQNQFASLVEKIESIKQNQTQSTEEINTLFDALMQKAFQGELIA